METERNQPKIVAYYRVSTARQGRSGLGLEAQERAVMDYAQQHGCQMMGSYTEVESGKVNERPELAKAMHHAKVTGSTLVIAKLDRLSRSAAFLTNLQESKVKFVCADNPAADETSVAILAVIARQEREAISKRTKDALAAAKARGKKLGNPNGAAALRRAGKGNTASVEAITAKADRFAADLAPVVADLQAEGKDVSRCPC